MTLKVKLRIDQILKITEEFRHLEDLALKRAQVYGGTLSGTDDEADQLMFPVLEQLQAHLIEKSRAGEFQGPDMKRVVAEWIDREIAELDRIIEERR